MASSPVPLLAVLAPFVASLIALVIGGKRPNAAGWISVGSIFVSLICLLTAAKDALAGTIHYFRTPWFPQLGVDLGIRLDGLSLVAGLVVAFVSFLIAVYSVGYMHGDPGLRRYWFFFSFFVGSMLLLVTADNLLLMLVGWEGTGLCSYALIGHWYTDEEERWVGDPGRTVWGTPMFFEPSHSGIRALVFTRLGDVGLLAGIAALFFTAGTLNFEALAEHHAWADALATRGLFLAVLIALSLGALAKSAQFPFHEWLVTAMTGPTSVSALIHAATMVNAGVYFLLRMSPIIWEVAGGTPLASQATTFFLFIAAIGAFTAFFMATQAVVSRELKLILAFSTASQLGYMFLGIGAGSLAGHVVEGFLAGLGHMFSQAFFKASLFMAAGALIHVLHTRFIDGMGALGGKLKFTAISMTLAAASLMGLAPFMGFWTKDACIHAAKAAGFTFGHVLGLVTAVLTATYSGRLLVRIFVAEPYESREHGHSHAIHEPPAVMLVPYALLAIGCLLVGLLWPYTFGTFVKLATSAVPGLSDHDGVHAGVVELEIDPAMLLFSIAAGVGIPLTLAYLYKARLNFVMELRTRLQPLHSFLYDRWYVNAIYYRTIAYPIKNLGSLLFKFWDTFVVDQFYHRFLPSFFSKLSVGSFGAFEVPVIDRVPNVRLVDAVKSLGKVAQKLQTGVLNHYLLLFLGGMVALGAMILMVV